jgi:hypothetical protein
MARPGVGSGSGIARRRRPGCRGGGSPRRARAVAKIAANKSPVPVKTEPRLLKARDARLPLDAELSARIAELSPIVKNAAELVLDMRAKGWSRMRIISELRRISQRVALLGARRRVP